MLNPSRKIHEVIDPASPQTSPNHLGLFFARNPRNPMIQNLLYFLIIPTPLLLFLMVTKFALSFVAFLALALFLKILFGD
jgi:hypothetical protein